jgi:hypothetical protein
MQAAVVVRQHLTQIQHAQQVEQAAAVPDQVVQVLQALYREQRIQVEQAAAVAQRLEQEAQE